MAASLKLKMGLQSVSKPQYATEPGYVAQVARQMKALQNELVDIMDQFEAVTPDIVIEVLQPTFDKSQEYCPHKTGDLRDSGYLESVGYRGQPRVEMGYARGGIPRYAVLVHEMVEVPHAAPTRSKFLEAAINEDFNSIIDNVQVAYMKFMGL